MLVQMPPFYFGIVYTNTEMQRRYLCILTNKTFTDKCILYKDDINYQRKFVFQVIYVIVCELGINSCLLNI